ncbi:ATP-dependent helicase [Microbulbifer hydrolyticus]|uniref:DNA 3'-5' helicase n=1 Tax=Microbulbifer hydrolyticus TaxID=48074 RepID=A0A6P1TB60_9GAMM|nr:ATP-dependent helicase [Microbulbifer hydrolyticus]MBB5210664.1 DNA helicase-2/ATP-dependent DNA helicase PcrA [Microbulbifer hydrolyticus]QHQ38876.1 UvrD-helicase domain-containing protein [Microbulbifer hydrolyticus]
MSGKESNLTEEQQAIANHAGGHAKIIAVAGSGKTTALLHYIKNRLEAGIAPQRMLVLMYNRSAKDDFALRLADLCGSQVPRVNTFHSLGFQLYQRMIARGQIERADLTPLPQSVVQLQIWKAIEACASPAEIEEIRARKQSETEAAEFFIDYTKTVLSGDLSAFQRLKLGDEYMYFLKVFRHFEDWRRARNAVTYADLIYDPAIVFSQQPEIAQQYGGFYEDILVDEYQDINEVQHYLLRILHGKSGNVIAIGDPDQTIYEWRGSRPEFLLRLFDGDFPPSNVYQLSRTFRYGHSLSLAANHFIQNNRERADVFCVSGNPQAKTHLQQVNTGNEGKWLVEHVRRCQQQGKSLGEMAILVRLWSLAAPLELALLAHNIPYRSGNRNTVLSRRELRPLFWSLNIAAGRFAEQSSKRRTQGLYEWLTAPHIRIPRAVLEPMCERLGQYEKGWGKQLLKLIPESLSQPQVKRLRQRAELLQQIEKWRGHGGELLRRQLGELDYLSGIGEDAFNRQQAEEKQQTILAFCQYLDQLRLPPRETLEHLQQLQLQHQQQSRSDSTNAKPTDTIQITTMHQAKGLEWDQVIIPSLTVHNMPYQPQRDFSTPASTESERRLMYVAMTRAKKQLYLLTPPTESTQQDTSSPDLEQKPSLFLDEMHLPLSNLLGETLRERPHNITTQVPITRLALRYLAACEYNPDINAPRAALRKPQLGESVRHQKLGYGRVTKWEDSKVEILFSDRRTRRFDWEKLTQFLM